MVPRLRFHCKHLSYIPTVLFCGVSCVGETGGVMPTHLPFCCSRLTSFGLLTFIWTGTTFVDISNEEKEKLVAFRASFAA